MFLLKTSLKIKKIVYQAESYCKVTLRNLEQPRNQEAWNKWGRDPLVSGTKEEQETLSSLQSWQQMPPTIHTQMTRFTSPSGAKNWICPCLREMVSGPQGAAWPALSISIIVWKKGTQMDWPVLGQQNTRLTTVPEQISTLRTAGEASKNW